MKLYRLISIAPFATLLVTSSAAAAGEFGPTSRGTVSISITIPPHVVISSAPTTANSGNTEGLCVRANGIGSYHVVLVPSAASPPVELQANPDADWCGAGAAAASSELLRDGSAVRARLFSRPVTLLVTPD